MSYCRFSSDDWKSDIYCYESYEGGFQIHVAANKTVGDAPKIPPLGSVSDEKWHEAYETQMKFLDTAERVQIGLEHDGEAFNEPTAKEAADKLEYLKELGYHVPQYVIDELREEL